jgi:regulator of sigma E protease
MFEFLLGNELLSSLIAFGLVLIPAVIVHEIGHFLAAKMVGITILEFGIGYPPRLFRMFRWRETEFTFNLIPLGGFVRPLGEDMIRTLDAEQTEKEREALLKRMAEESNDVLPESPDPDDRKLLAARGFTKLRTVNEAPPLARIFFMAAGALANLIAALVLFVIIGLIGINQIVGTGFALTDVRPDSVLAEAGVQSGDAIESVDGEYVVDSNELLAALEARRDQDVTLGILRPVDETSAPEEFTVTIPANTLNSDLGVTTYGLQVGDIQEGSPAEAAGLQPGDTIVELNGESLETTAVPFELLQSINAANAGREITITFVRDGKRQTVPITPRENPAPGQGYLGAGVETQLTSQALGISYVQFGIIDSQPLSLGDAVNYGFNQLGMVLNAIVSLPGRLLSGNAAPGEDRFISIVGISQVGALFLQRSVESGSPFEILNFIALVNIALGLTNLLPLPPLDGGRILFIIIEMFRGKPMSQRREEAIMIIGMVFLLALGVVVILQDIANPIRDLIAR